MLEARNHIVYKEARELLCLLLPLTTDTRLRHHAGPMRQALIALVNASCDAHACGLVQQAALPYRQAHTAAVAVCCYLNYMLDLGIITEDAYAIILGKRLGRRLSRLIRRLEAISAKPEQVALRM